MSLDVRQDVRAAGTEMGPAVLWLCGAPGVGKSVTAWALFHALGDEGSHVAYVDIDQLGMLYPANDDDPYRYRLKAEALAALLPNYAAAGVQLLVVSGVVDATASGDVATLLRGARTTFCLLTVADATLRDRILERGWAAEEADEAVIEADALLKAPFIDAVVDTTGSSVAEVIRRLRPLVDAMGASHRAASSRGRAAEDAPPPPSTRMRLTVVSGPRAVGSSTVGFHLARSRWGRGRTTGFMDLQQLAFLRTPGQQGHSGTGLGITNVATLHRLFGLRGADHVVVSGHLDTAADHDSLRQSTADSQVTIVRLQADAATLAAHLRERSVGSEARLAGDDLIGASESQQALMLEVALEEQHALQADAAQDLVVEVSGRSIDEVVSDVEERVSEDGDST